MFEAGIKIAQKFWLVKTRPLPLARLRARDQLVDLRQFDLRFAPDETIQFITRMMGLTLTAPAKPSNTR